MKYLSIKSTMVCAAVTSAAFASAISAQTIDNLKAAYKGETTAFSKYSQYAAVAKHEGKPYEANLFAAAAKSESIHARNHRKVLTAHGVTVKPSKYEGKVGSTLDNLKDALKGETYEKDTMYPQFIAAAEKSGDADAVETFTYAYEAEKAHADFYGQAVKAESDGKATARATFYVCPTCGNTFLGQAPTACPVCYTEDSKFLKVK